VKWRFIANNRHGTFTKAGFATAAAAIEIVSAKTAMDGETFTEHDLARKLFGDFVWRRVYH
jgi:hypothetical protein